MKAGTVAEASRKKRVAARERVCTLVGAPVDSGAGQPGCSMGPAALRIAGIADALSELGYAVRDRGDVAPALSHDSGREQGCHAPTIRNLAQTACWAAALEQAAFDAAAGGMAIFLGGDHSLSLGTAPGVARYARSVGRPQFVLWLDAHPDFHTLETSESGNLHGTPVAYFTGQPGFGACLPALVAPIDPARVCMIGVRSVDAAERVRLADAGITVHDMRAIDEHGVVPLLRGFLDRVAAANGLLHVSLDIDFLDPAEAPGVGTSVPGGATFREAHLIMEMLHDSGLTTTLDLVELNPFLDERGRTARLMVDLSASLMGKRILDRPTTGA